MKSIITFFVKNSFLVNLFIILFLVFGVLSASRLGSSFFPLAPTENIEITVVYPGASPEEIEEGITTKIEENLKGIVGIERVTSVSYENQSRINVEIKSGGDIDVILQDVKNGVDQISSFPTGLEKKIISKKLNKNRAIEFALVGDLPLRTLKNEAEQVELQLRGLNTISQIDISGFTEEEIEVAVKEEILRSYGLTLADISLAIQKENVKVTGGTIKGDKEVLIRSDNKYYEAEQLENIVVRQSQNGAIVRLKDVADIHEDWSEDTNKVLYNGKEAILFNITTLNEEDILDAVASVKNFIQKYNKRSKNTQLKIVNDSTVALNERIELLTRSGRIGLILVVILIGLFLRIRVSLWVALGIPISFLGMIIMAYYFGITINVLSLFGMILVIGILVDDGIVVAENIFQHYERGEDRITAAVNGTLEVIPSVLSAITTTVVAFSIFFFIDGRLGDFFSDVAFVVIWALIFSFIEVLLFLPAHLAHTKDLAKDYEPSKIKESIENSLIWVRDKTFMPVLNFSIKYKFLFFAICVSSFLLALGIQKMGLVKIVFFPTVEAKAITVDLETASSTSQKVTEKAIDKVIAGVDKLNQKYIDDSTIGKPLIVSSKIIFGPQSNIAKGVFYLIDSKEKPIPSEQINEDLRATVGVIPEAKKLSFDTGSPFGKPINISFASTNYQEIRKAIAEFKTALSETNMVVDLIDNDTEDLPEVNITLKEQARLLGLNESLIMSQIRNGFFGFQAQRLQRGNDEVKVWVRYDMEGRDELSDLRNMKISTPKGTYPLSQLVTIENTLGIQSINHRDAAREISVFGSLKDSKVDANLLFQKIEDEILPQILSKYPNISVIFEGQKRLMLRTQRSIAKAGPIILLIMLTMLIITFRSYSQAIALICLVPFGLVGMIFGHWLHGLQISILSGLGFVALTGVILNDGLVFVNAFNEYLKKGLKYNEALRETALSRFRPIVLTTFTTAAGLLPLIFETSFQAQFLIPMGITVAYGLLAGSFFVTLLLPVTLSLFNNLKVYIKYFWTGIKPERESVENVIKMKIEAQKTSL